MNQDLRISKGKEMKEKILLASMEIINLEGLEGISAQKIAGRLGISKSNVFHHFGSIESILDTIFETILSELVDPIKSYQGGSLESFLTFLGEGIYQLDDEDKLTYAVLLNFYNASLHNDKYKTQLIIARDTMVGVISKQLSCYSSREENHLLTMAQMIVMTLDGYGMSFLLQSDEGLFRKMWKLQVTSWQYLLQ